MQLSDMLSLAAARVSALAGCERALQMAARQADPPGKLVHGARSEIRRQDFQQRQAVPQGSIQGNAGLLDSRQREAHVAGRPDRALALSPEFRVR